MKVNLPGPFLKVYLTLCEDVNTPRSLQCYLLAKYGELRQLVTLKVLPGAYLSAEDYIKDAVVVEFLRKCEIPEVVSAKKLEEECWQRLRATEAACFVTNKRLARFTQATGLLDQPEDPAILRVIMRAQAIIRSCLGSLPPSLHGRFGPGATLTNSSRRSTLPDKLASTPAGTTRALELFRELNRQDECAWLRYNAGYTKQRSFDTVRGNRFFTVPKTALSFRGAALSPNVNGFLQLAVGTEIRLRLKRVGIHIQSNSECDLFSVNRFTTTDRHRDIVSQASRSGDLATIDLSDASNTIAYNLIKLLWPREWFELLDALREPLMEGPDGANYRLEMFSAMGNGFTFEMETLTFYAITRALSPNGFVSVFGDDIICPTTASGDVVAALRWFGFTPNQSKTFTTGPFRESCGSDYFDGVPVRAHYVKTLPSEPTDWITLANGLRRVAFGDSSTHHRWSYLRNAWFRALDNIPSNIRRCRGPVTLGDLCIHDDVSFLAKYARYQTAQGITYWRCIVPIPYSRPLEKWGEETVMASALMGQSSKGVTPRGAIKGYTLEWLPDSSVSYDWKPSDSILMEDRQDALESLISALRSLIRARSSEMTE